MPRQALFAICLTALIANNHVVRAGQHSVCQDDKLNTYQHGDCEKEFADQSKKGLETTIKSLEKPAEMLGVGDELVQASSAFGNFVDKECRLQGDVTFGTMGTYVVEECRSTYFDDRNKIMTDLLHEFEDDIKIQGSEKLP